MVAYIVELYDVGRSPSAGRKMEGRSLARPDNWDRPATARAQACPPILTAAAAICFVTALGLVGALFSKAADSCIKW